jgi:hypothetical protein
MWEIVWKLGASLLLALVGYTFFAWRRRKDPDDPIFVLWGVAIWLLSRILDLALALLRRILVSISLHHRNRKRKALARKVP